MNMTRVPCLVYALGVSILRSLALFISKLRSKKVNSVRLDYDIRIVNSFMIPDLVSVNIYK